MRGNDDDDTTPTSQVYDQRYISKLREFGEKSRGDSTEKKRDSLLPRRANMMQADTIESRVFSKARPSGMQFIGGGHYSPEERGRATPMIPEEIFHTPTMKKQWVDMKDHVWLALMAILINLARVYHRLLGLLLKSRPMMMDSGGGDTQLERVLQRQFTMRTLSILTERSNEIVEMFSISRDRMEKMYTAFQEQLVAGLKMRQKDPVKWHPEESDFMMIDCCLKSLPTGLEKGVFYAVDFGGTNVRAVRAVLDGSGSISVSQLSDSIREEGISPDLPKGVLDRRATAKMLFDAIAKRVLRLMEREGDLAKIKPPMKVPVGLCFSFGLLQTKLDSAILTHWSKDFETGVDSNDPVVTRDVCALLNSAFERLKIPAVVNSLLNDTTGTLIAAALERPPELPPVLIGLICGTGLNACYVEDDAPNFSYGGVVVNVEAGGFARHLPKTIFDVQIDFQSANPGMAPLEKMISGLYLEEICRLAILHCFRDLAPPKAWDHASLPMASIAGIYSSQPSEMLTTAAAVLRKYWNWEPNNEALKCVVCIIEAAMNRSARLIAMLIAALAKKTKRLQPALNGLTVGVDGSLYTKNPRYQQCVSDNLVGLLGSDIARLVHWYIASDGSGKGAAILAATVSHHGRHETPLKEPERIREETFPKNAKTEFFAKENPQPVQPSDQLPPIPGPALDEPQALLPPPMPPGPDQASPPSPSDNE